MTGYEILRDGSPIATVGAVTSYTDTTVSPLTHYDYAVKAIDAAGNRSTPSNTAGVNTPAPPASTTATFNVVADARVEQPTADHQLRHVVEAALDQRRSGHAELPEVLALRHQRHRAVREAADLRLERRDQQRAGHRTRRTSSWTESGITWNNRPALIGTPSDNKVQIAIGTWVEYDVTPLVTGNGDVTFALIPDSTDGANFASKEYTDPSKKAQLEVTYGG